MDEVQAAQVKVRLLAAQVAIQDALAIMGTTTPRAAHGDVILPNGEAACRHPRRVAAMGGYWSCPDCGAQGREENE